MLQMLRKRLNKDEEGFTLIELMVVVLIIAILLAIAIPTFLGARSRAQNRAAESNARNALTAEKTAYTDNQTYLGTTVSSIEPSLSFVGATPAKASNQVSVVTGDSGNTICIASQSGTGNYYSIFDVAQADTSGNFTGAGTFYGSSTSGATACPTATTGGVPTGGTGTWGTTTSGGGW